MARFKHIELNWNAGSIHGLTNNAIKTAEAFDCKVTFPFNGIKITVDKYSNVDYISNKALDNVANQLGDIK
jgi:hypothetical protein